MEREGVYVDVKTLDEIEHKVPSLLYVGVLNNADRVMSHLSLCFSCLSVSYQTKAAVCVSIRQGKQPRDTNVLSGVCVPVQQFCASIPLSVIRVYSHSTAR